MENKKRIIIIGVVGCIIAFLYSIGLFQNNNIYSMLFVIVMVGCILTYIIFKVENHIEKNHKQDKINFENIDFVRYGFSVIIIIMHLRPFLGNMDRLDLIFNNILSRICVPLFFMITGYFVAKKEKENPDYIKQYIQSMLPIYISWSLIYLPLAIAWLAPYLPQLQQILTQYSIPNIIIPFVYIIVCAIALIIGFTYIGIYYHLWYFPALFLSLYTIRWLKDKISIRTLLAISFVFLLFGASETYYGIIPNNIQEIFDIYYKIFFTTRNFLFFGLFYVVLGYYMGNKTSIYASFSFLKVIVCIFLLFIETSFLQTITRLDSNILLSCIPLVYYLFISLMYMNTIISFKKHKVRSLYKYYYLLHPWIIVIVQYLVSLFTKEITSSIHFLWIELFLVLLFTHLISELIIKLQSKKHLKYL